MWWFLILAASRLCFASVSQRIVHRHEQQQILIDHGIHKNAWSTWKPNHAHTLKATFDDISLNNIANHTLNYTNMPLLEFERFFVMNTTAAAAQGYLKKGDVNCAYSRPNALHSVLPNNPAPGIFRSNATALSAKNYSEFFDLKAFAVKPVGNRETYSAIAVNAWEIDEGEAKNVYSMSIIWGAAGYLDPSYVEPPKYWPGWGERVNAVEMKAYSLYEEEPLEFCLDDLVLEFREAE